ncbi:MULTISPECIES: DAK2 domain-containing protein [unclassified Rhodococcus (in: high G+C Gram-positive bacteria)]|uniref:DAK2 domain-containing protein n=1 Tax=Rhodococcus sp. SJ-3 TaxID=3454628 RepID=UPI003F78DD31
MLEGGEGVDGRALRRWVELALATLDERCHEINTLNVFPVPDGDTGTNLLATLRAAADELGGPVDGALTVGAVAEALARGAFVGARGNSGVILAQGLRGVADSIAGLTAVDGRDFARALGRAATTVTDALSTPAEGTIVTVLRAAADGAGRAVIDTKSLRGAVGAAADAAATALEVTPEQLEALAAAGVVDAGGLGLLILLDCLVEIVSGQRPDRHLRLTSTPVADTGGPDVPDHDAAEQDGESQDYEVMYIVDGSDRARIAVLRARLDELGDSVAIVGDGSAGWSVHVHCCDAGAAIEAGIAAGRLRRIAITCFTLEADRVGQCAPSASSAPSARVSASGRAVLAIVSGDGAEGLFDAEGATVLSAETAVDPRLLLDAIRSLPSTDVLVLPNGWVSEQDVVAVGAQARAGRREVMFLPCSSMVQGLASLAVHDAGRATVDDAFAMSEAAAATRWGSLRYATERALTWVGTCQPGDSLGLAGRDVVVIEHDLVAAGVSLLDKILAAGGELVTMLVGDGAPDGLAEQLTRHLDDRHPELEVVVYQGGQRSDLLQLGVE